MYVCMYIYLFIYLLEFGFNIFMMQDGPGISGGGDLIIDLGDALVKQRPNCTSGIELTKSRENRLQSHIQHRLTQLEGYYFLSTL